MAIEAVAAFVSAVAKASAVRRPSVGRGEDVRLQGESVVGSGLELESELLQLSAFGGGERRPQSFGRIARPSTRYA